LQSFDELLEFIEIWGFAISFATCRPGNRYEYNHVVGGGAAAGATTRSSSLAACIKELPVLTSTGVENYSLATDLYLLKTHSLVCIAVDV